MVQPRRYADEVCDFCWYNRRSYANGIPKGQRPNPMSYQDVDCRCGPRIACRDARCAWVNKKLVRSGRKKGSKNAKTLAARGGSKVAKKVVAKKGKPMSRSGMQYFVRDSQGADYKVGRWRDGYYRPGSLADAFRELDMLGEMGATVVDEDGAPQTRPKDVNGLMDTLSTRGGDPEGGGDLTQDRSI